MKGKGKGKGKETADSWPLQFPDLSPLDPATHCPVYSAILERHDSGEGEHSVQMSEIDKLQFELEALLISIMKRTDDLEEETGTIASQEKKDKKSPAAAATGKTIATVSGKRTRTSEGKPPKKQKDNSGKVHFSTTVGRPKTKNSQSTKVVEYDYSAASPAEAPTKPGKTDASSRFWASVEPYMADITQDHLKFLEDWIKTHDDDDEYFKIPPLGSHYSCKWSNNDLHEEQKEGAKANEKRKGLSNNSSLNSADADKILSQVDTDSDSDDGSAPLGPLAQRLVSCLIEKKIMPSMEDTIATPEEIPEFQMSPQAKIRVSPHTKGKSMKSFNIVNADELEKRIRKELEEAGLMMPEVEESENPEDAVLTELKQVQASLKLVIEYNITQKKRLLTLAKEEITRQEIKKKMQLIDSEIMNIHHKQKKKVFSKRERDHALQKLKEREIMSNELENIEIEAMKTEVN